jgi:hypothetical protein
MSMKAVQWAFGVNAGGSRNKAVLVALADCVNKDHADNTCFPKIRTLVQTTELKERAVKAALADLEKRTLISRRAQYLDGTRYRRASLIKLHLDISTDQKDGAAHAPHSAPDAPYGAPGAPGMVHDVHPNMVHHMHHI